MAIIEIDDGFYLDAMQYIWGLEGAHGMGEAFQGWLDAHQPQYEPWQRDLLVSMLAGFVGHVSGEYDVESGTSLEKRIVWSFHRAWLDRDGVPH